MVSLNNRDFPSGLKYFDGSGEDYALDEEEEESNKSRTRQSTRQRTSTRQKTRNQLLKDKRWL